MREFTAGKYSLPIGSKTYIMGILNVTPDSFSDGGEYFSPEAAINRAYEIEGAGADILDIGGQSTRPGSTRISFQEELSRVKPVLEGLVGKLHIPISLDTYYYEVAKWAVDIGVDIINDVGGFVDKRMVTLAGEGKFGCVVMHSGKESSINDFFVDRINALNVAGVKSSKICLDPGIGFGKGYNENLKILANISKYKLDNFAFLVGASRKRVIREACGESVFRELMPGTIAAHTLTIAGGADIIRVHDVRESVQAARVADAILQVSGHNYLPRSR